MQAGAVSLIDCKSCGAKNNSEMSFCIQCGKVLSSSFEALRQARGVKKRECPSCLRSDELNNRYCVFCGAEIEVFVGRSTNQAALAKFSDDVHSLVETLPNPTKSYAALPAMQPQVVIAESKISGPQLDYFLLIGLVSGIAVPLVIGANTLAQFVLGTQLPGNGFLLFAEKPNTQVTLESMDRTNYTLGQTSKRGVFYIKDLSGAYRLRLNLPGHRTMLQKLDIAKGRLNCLGFDKPVSLPLSQGADGPQ